MKARGDIETVNLSTGERRERVTGGGESFLRSCHCEPRLGPKPPTEAEMLADAEKYVREIKRIIEQQKEQIMHYRNGREAKNGDKIVKLEGGKVVSFGVLHSAVPGNDYCNGNIAVIQPPSDYACMVDCLHVDDLAVLLNEKGLDKRPPTK